MIKVSIIIPAYNAQEYIADAIKSALNQTLKEIEIIIVDDGSIDNTLSLLKEYEKLHSSIHVYSQANQKQGAARNLGLSKARGEYIYFLDADDYLDLEAMKICYNTMKQNDLELLTFDAYTFYEEGAEENPLLRQYARENLGIDTKKIWCGKEFFYLYWKKKGVFVTPWSMMLKRSFLDEEHIKFVPGIFFEDNVFALEVYQKAKKMQYISDKLYYRRYRKNSVMVSDYTEFHLFSYLVVVKEILSIVINEMGETIYSEDRIQFWLHNVRRLLNVWDQMESLVNNACRNEFIILMDVLNQNCDLLAGRKEAGKVIMFIKKLQEKALSCWEEEEIIRACDGSNAAIEKMYKLILERYLDQIDLNVERKIGFWGNNQLIKMFIKSHCKQKGLCFSELFYIQKNEEFSDPYWGKDILSLDDDQIEQLDKIYIIESFMGEREPFAGKKVEVLKVPFIVVDCLRCAMQNEDENTLKVLIDLFKEAILIINSAEDIFRKEYIIKKWRMRFLGIEKMVEEDLKKCQEPLSEIFNVLRELCLDGMFIFCEDEAKSILYQVKKILNVFPHDDRYLSEVEEVQSMCTLWSQSIYQYLRIKEKYANVLQRDGVVIKIEEIRIQTRRELIRTTPMILPESCV